MNIGVMGSTGRLGSIVVRQALDRGHRVVAFSRSGRQVDSRETPAKADLFSLEAADLADLDVFISCFGGGFGGDASVNRKAFGAYERAMRKTGIRVIAIAGAGSLYTDASHTTRAWEAPGYSSRLLPISRATGEGIDDLKAAGPDLSWTVVTPSEVFDFDGPLTNSYRIGTGEVALADADGNSHVTYEDLASAMLDISEEGSHLREVVTVLTDVADKG